MCILVVFGCSTRKNTATTRLYHSINTRYNIYFNANEAYKENLKERQKSYQDTLSQIIDIYPVFDKNESFTTSVDKTTKAIKLHSIKAKPERKPSKKRDPKYKLWLQQQEFNPFLKNAWLLLGKSEYQDGDFVQSVSTFFYVTRLYKTDPEVVAEARIWMVKANVAMGWFYEAEDILNQVRLAGGVPENLELEYNKVYADFYVKQRSYDKAIPYVIKAIDKENDGLQKTRLKYLLGQLYQKDGSKEKAFNAFDDVHGLSTPYIYSFNAHIQQSSLVGESNRTQILSQLEKMSKDSKNKEYLDQVYYAIGNIYLNERDTVRAIDNYKKSIKKSTRNGFDKALSSMILGEIYFEQKDYIDAQPCYSDAASLLGKKHDNYEQVALRSEVLDELVVYVKAVHLQDSLQQLAKMSEPERLNVITKLIADLKKQEKESLQQEQTLTNKDNSPTHNSLFDDKIPSFPIASPTTGSTTSAFYFYNPQTVTQGKVAFQRKWGVRKLEDNWRRKNKQISILDNNETPFVQDSLGTGTSNDNITEGKNDIYSVDFYLQQIPFTTEAIAASNAIIENAFFNMGKIYKDKLGDYNLAIEAFNTDLSRFPDTPNLEEIYYQLFLIYLKLGNKEMMEIYRLNILSSFPNSSYAAALTDPNYEWNMLNMYQMEDQLYQNTYDNYLKGKVNVVRSNYNEAKEKYPLSNLIPKFMFLNSLTYAQVDDSEGFKSNLKDLITKYPKADVTPLATEMLKGVMAGRQLSSDNSPFRGMIWDIKLGSDTLNNDKGVDFIADPDSEYLLLLVYNSGTVDKNELIYDVANYNFSNYIYQTFDLSFVKVNSLEMLQVRGFRNLKDIISYIDKTFTKNSLISQLDPSVIPIPISTDNYIALMNGKTLNQYFLFFEKNYTKEMLNLIKYWASQKNRTTEKPVQLPEQSESEKTEPIEEPEIVVEKSQDESQFIPDSPILPEQSEIRQTESGKTELGVGTILSEEQIEKADRVVNKAIDIINNPVDGLKNIFKSSKNDSELTKEEKKAQKELEKRQKQEEKLLKEQIKEKSKAIEKAQQARQDSLEVTEQVKRREEQNIERKEIDAEKVRQTEQEQVRKQKEQNLKIKEKNRKEELKAKEQDRKKRLKEKEQERKKQLKRREEELKAKERLVKERTKTKNKK